MTTTQLSPVPPTYEGEGPQEGDIVVVSLQGKFHHCDPARTYFQPNLGRRVPAPACGQKARRFHPSSFYGPAEQVSCEKCKGQS